MNFIRDFKEIFEESTYRICKNRNLKESDYQLMFELFAKGYKGRSLRDVLREIDVSDGRMDFVLSFDDTHDCIFEFKVDRRDSDKIEIINSMRNQAIEYIKRTNINCLLYVIFGEFYSIEHKAEFNKVISELYNEGYFVEVCYINCVCNKKKPSKM